MFNLSKKFKEFLFDNETLINTNDFQKVLDKALDTNINYCFIWPFLILCYYSGINILTYLERINFTYYYLFNIKEDLGINENNIIQEAAEFYLDLSKYPNIERIVRLYYPLFSSKQSLIMKNIGEIKEGSVGYLDIPSILINNCKVIEEASFQRPRFNKLVLNDINEIKNAAFSSNNRLEKISLSNVKKLDTLVFSYCRQLSDVKLDKVQEIGSQSFSNCASLKEIFIPKSVKVLGDLIFFNCHPDLIIYCGAEEKPKDWSFEWNQKNEAGDTYEVIWGASNINKLR